MPRDTYAAEIGRKLTNAYRESGLSIRELAHRAGITENTVAKYKRGDIPDPVIFLVRLIAELERDVSHYLPPMESSVAKANRLWEKHKLSETLSLTPELSYGAKREILENKGLWEE